MGLNVQPAINIGVTPPASVVSGVLLAALIAAALYAATQRRA